MRTTPTKYTGLMWSSRPLTACRLEESGVWINVPDTHLELILANDVTSLISYSMVVVAAKPQLPGSSFLGQQQSNGGNKDFLQVFAYAAMQQLVATATQQTQAVLATAMKLAELRCRERCHFLCTCSKRLAYMLQFLL